MLPLRFPLGWVSFDACSESQEGELSLGGGLRWTFCVSSLCVLASLCCSSGMMLAPVGQQLRNAADGGGRGRSEDVAVPSGFAL